MWTATLDLAVISIELHWLSSILMAISGSYTLPQGGFPTRRPRARWRYFLAKYDNAARRKTKKKYKIILFGEKEKENKEKV
ncbi:hypothetical protein TorRG33x02_003130 [Trema orientale]|uniref:Uncharacterized protein n=1 Tax=Trema orientale TaxID=63057 RepID=A0A2P5G1W6_TREOI|nr:hypothetical protein TorRG33x02_003130 [Trema orientale]